MLAGRQHEARAPNAIGLELLDDNLVEERSELLLHGVQTIDGPVPRIGAWQSAPRTRALRRHPSRAARSRPGWRVAPAPDGRGAQAGAAADDPVEPAPLHRDPDRAVRPELGARADLRARREGDPRALHADLPEPAARRTTSRRSRRPARRSRASSRRTSHTRTSRPSASKPRCRPSPTRSSSRTCSRSTTSSSTRSRPASRSLLETILFSFGPTILLVALFIWLFRRAASAG